MHRLNLPVAASDTRRRTVIELTYCKPSRSLDSVLFNYVRLAIPRVAEEPNCATGTSNYKVLSWFRRFTTSVRPLDIVNRPTFRWRK